MALTQKQIHLVQHSFSLVEPIAEKAAEIFYDALFRIDPSLKLLFRNDMKVQGNKLMTMLKAAVDGLDDLEALVPALQLLAQRHNAYGTKKSHFTPVGNALLHTLKIGLGDAFTDEVRQAWVSVIHVISDTMKPEVKE